MGTGRDTFLRNPHGAPVDAKWNKVCIECHSVAGKAAVSMTPGTNRQN